ncbi:helix-turn-helix transcriptional regulator [Kitasatospora sp. YST-16]|uniref:helix-turn-helix domain-containing protein n=1 Tax=Kitasatospora sp. YST-16 TaxID=2998080 RepID=UPI002284E289|nr:helix-turn-helix transcriptional regulator [Kitasatospora sp. YST-16]WAL73406.1 helix-turn-helix transcriptional regulator [Kitasatospora sp. YST-16]WNW39461.1 helix-turn-helix transcriptional regulator [Streptomyces sp. Li-HN-5-13]
MAHPKPLDPYESPRSFYGSELRRLREDRGLSQERLGELVFCSGAYVGQIEAATRRPQEDMSERFDSVLETGGHLARLYPLVTRTIPAKYSVVAAEPRAEPEPVTRMRFAEYFTTVAELQSVARTISSFSPTLVPGLLQTPEYARAVFRAAQPLRPAADIADRVRLRMDRARIFDRPTSPLYWAVLDESVIRRPVGGAATMAEQLLSIVELARKNRIVVQVLPFSAGAHALMEGELCLLTFADAPPAAYVEGPHAGQLIDDSSTVAECVLSYDFTRVAAMPPEESLDLIESVAEEYAQGRGDRHRGARAATAAATTGTAAR